MSGIKITPADHYFSLCIRERANWKCEKCGKKYPKNSSGLQCSHYWGRGAWSTRLDPLNGDCLCYYHHMKFTANPGMYYDWKLQKLGAEKYNILEEKNNNITLGKEYKQTRGVGEIAAHYKSEYERMLKLRAMGKKGRIEFKGWL